MGDGEFKALLSWESVCLGLVETSVGSSWQPSKRAKSFIFH